MNKKWNEVKVLDDIGLLLETVMDAVDSSVRRRLLCRMSDDEAGGHIQFVGSRNVDSF